MGSFRVSLHPACRASSSSSTESAFQGQSYVSHTAGRVHPVEVWPALTTSPEERGLDLGSAGPLTGRLISGPSLLSLDSFPLLPGGHTPASVALRDSRPEGQAGRAVRAPSESSY